MLIADHQEWSRRALESVFAPEGYAIDCTYSAKSTIAAVRQTPPDLVLVNAQLPGDPVELCMTLRREPRVGHCVPIVMVSSDMPSRRLQLRAMRAGVWEFVTHPVRIEHWLPKLENYVRAKLEMEDVREHSLVDSSTGFYNRLGLEQRAGEIGSQARREHWSLACVVIAPDASDVDEQARDELLGEASTRLSELLRQYRRGSDAVGRLGPTEFAIIAPNTDRDGIVRIIERIQAAMSEPHEFEQPSIRLRAGYDAIDRLDENPTSVQNLVARAAEALRGTDPDERWIRPFTPDRFGGA